MENRIEFYIQFDYKGETHRPALSVDLDSMMQQQGEIPSLYPLIARENGIGLYSYELEVMESLPLQVATAEGLAADFVNDSVFDQQGFERAWYTEQNRSKVEVLASEHLDEALLKQHPQIVEVMLAAFQLGKESS